MVNVSGQIVPWEGEIAVRLLMLGPPGAGKGTQSARIAEALGVPAISTGEIFRENIRERTPLGLKVKAIIESGRYVPDDVTNRIVFERLEQSDAANGYLLDGYPRTVDQVLALREYHWARNVDLDHVLELVVPDELVVERLVKRSSVEGRVDDTAEVIRERLRVYHRQTAPISKMASERGLLRQVDGVGDVSDVFARCMEALSLEVSSPSRPRQEV